MWGRRTELHLDERILARLVGRRSAGTRLMAWVVRLQWRATKGTIRVGVRHRVKLMPTHTAMAAWTAAAACAAADQGVQIAATAAAAGALLLYVNLGGPLGRFTRRRNRKPRRHTLWWCFGYTGMAGYVVAAAAMPVMLLRPGWLIAVWLPCQLAWSWHRRTRPSEQVPLTDVQATWGKVDKVADTELYEIEEFTEPKRVTALVDLTNVDLLPADVRRAIPHIAKRFRLPPSNFVVEDGPGGVQHVASLAMVFQNPTDGPVLYDQTWWPTPAEIADGTVKFHLYPDGQRGRLRFMLPGAGAVNLMLSGDPRVGKSQGMTTLGIQLMRTGLVWPIGVDPQGGVSMPALVGRNNTGAFPWQAPCDEDDFDPAWRVLCAVREIMYARNRALTRFEWQDEWGDRHVGLNCWDARITGWPLMYVMLDEFWALMRIPEIAHIFKECVKMAGKVGIGFAVATQYPAIDEFGNDPALRQPMLAQAAAYRNREKGVGAMTLPPNTPSPDGIPDVTATGQHTKGMLIAVSQAAASSRPTYSRTVWAERDRHEAKQAAAFIPALEPAAAEIVARWMDPTWDPADRATIITVPAGTPTKVSADVPAPPATRKRVLDRIVAWLSDPTKCQAGRARTGQLAIALDVPRSTISTTLHRATQEPGCPVVRCVADGQDIGTWQYLPPAATEKENAA